MIGLRPTLSRRKGSINGANVSSTATARLRMRDQDSTYGVMIDHSGNGHHGFYGGVKRAFVGDSTLGGGRCIYLPGIASNNATLAGLSNSTTYDLTITYYDDSTDTVSIATDGSGNLAMGNTTTEFSDKWVKSVSIEPNGGGAVVDVVDFTGIAQGVRSFTSDQGNTVTVNQAGSSTAEPTLLWHDGTTKVWLPGTSGNYASVPDAAALDITGDIDIRCRAALTDWTPGTSMALLSKFNTSSNRSYLFYVNTAGRLVLETSADGNSGGPTGTSTAAVTVSDAAVVWVRVALDVNDGGGNRVYNFYQSDDGSSWTQIGSTVTTAGTTTIYSGTSVMEVGSYQLGTGFPLAGHIYSAQIYNGIAGTKVLDIDFTDDSAYNATQTSLTAVTGQTVTLNISATGLKTTVVDENKMVGDGVDDYVSILDHARLNFALTDSFTIGAALRRFGTGTGNVVAKLVNGATAGWRIGTTGSTAYFVDVKDGTVSPFDAAPVFTSGARQTIVLLRNVAQDTITAFQDGVSSGSPTTDTNTGTSSNAADVRIFAQVDGTFLAASLTDFLLYRRALTDAQITQLNRELAV